MPRDPHDPDIQWKFERGSIQVRFCQGARVGYNTFGKVMWHRHPLHKTWKRRLLWASQKPTPERELLWITLMLEG